MGNLKQIAALALLAAALAGPVIAKAAGYAVPNPLYNEDGSAKPLWP